MLKRWMKRVRREEGQSLVEYALIIALVAIVLIAGLTALSGGITGAFNTIIASL
ncbi:MAG: Flp family type IVb pilin [Nitrospinota bacterium]